MTFIPTHINDAVYTPASQTVGPSDQAGNLSKNFMTLLITQLKHQNPLEPMESGDLLNQLAAMTSVSELNDIRSGISSLNEHFAAGQMASATALLGQELAIEAGQFEISDDSGQLSLSFPSPGSGRTMPFTLIDQSGRVAEAHYRGRRGELPGTAVRQGLQQLFGSLDNGQYWLRADGDEAVPVQLVSRAESVVFNGGDRTPMIRLAGAGPVSLAAVRRVTQP